MADQADAARVLVLHGLWMRGLALSALVHRLRQAGMQAETFDFMSVQASVDDTVARLRAHLADSEPPVHVVGHSLGGLLALQALDHRDALPRERIVCLGSPLIGSAAARHLERWGAGALLGGSRALLEQGMGAWHGPRELGVVAGTLSLGFGGLLGLPAGDDDGTVVVAETRLPGLTDHCCVAASHTGLLFSPRAAEQTVHFLQHGHFRRL